MIEISESQSPPKDYPQIIYKYRDWQIGYHRNILTHNQIFLASPKDFNDPFDCRIPEDFLSLDTTKKRNQYADQFVIRHFNDPEVKGREEYWLKEIPRRLESDPQGMHDHMEKIQKEFQDKYYGIISFSCDWDNLLMWSHYGASHTGICIGFKEENLRNFGRFGGGGKVICGEAFPRINPIRDVRNVEREVITKVFEEIFTKAKNWKYENEYRIFKLLYPGIPSISDRIVEIPDEFYSEIILGLNFPPEEIKYMQNLSKQKNVPLYQLQKIPFEFKLNRILIS